MVLTLLVHQAVGQSEPIVADCVEPAPKLPKWFAWLLYCGMWWGSRLARAHIREARSHSETEWAQYCSKGPPLHPCGCSVSTTAWPGDKPANGMKISQILHEVCLARSQDVGQHAGYKFGGNALFETCVAAGFSSTLKCANPTGSSLAFGQFRCCLFYRWSATWCNLPTSCDFFGEHLQE